MRRKVCNGRLQNYCHLILFSECYFRVECILISYLFYNFPFLFLKGLVTPAQESAVKGCIDKLERILTCATKKRPDGPPSVLSDVDPKTTEREKLKSFFAKTLATQMVQKGMANLTDYELHKLVYAIAVKTSLDDGNLVEPPKYPPAPSPPPPQQGYGYYGQGYATGPSTSAM